MSWICFCPFHFAAYVVAEKDKKQQNGNILQRIMEHINKATPADRIVVTDLGHLIDLTYVSLDCCWCCDTFPSILT